MSSGRGSLGTDLVVARVNSKELGNITAFIHEEELRCGGYFAFTTQKEAEVFLASERSAATLSHMRGTGYTIDNQVTVDAWLPEVSESGIHATISHLSGYRNRYYTSSYGKTSAEWIRDTWQSLAAGRADASVALFTGCTDCSTQPSVILTVQGQELPDEVVVIGAHLDSINRGSANVEQDAPGADDDASGIATVTEVIRIAMASGWKPKRTVKFMGYAAEEVGLRGSNAIAQRFRTDNVNVVGVLQLDMTNYKSGNVADMRIVTDYSNAALRAFFAELFDAYLLPLGMTRGTYACGYGCSDHASWTSAGFPAVMLFEAGNESGAWFPGYHTENDTLAGMGDSALNTTKFAKFGLAFLGELAKTHDDEAPGNIAPTADFTFTVDGMTATFTDASTDTDGSIAAHLWDFGDGATSTLANPAHTFTQVGTHAVTLTVTDDGGLDSSKTREVSSSSHVVALTNGEPMNGLAADAGTQQFFTLEVPVEAMDLRFTLVGVDGEDVDLRLEFSGQLVCNANSAASSETCGISHPAAGTYTAIVIAQTNLSQFTITGRYVERTADMIFRDGFDP